MRKVMIIGLILIICLLSISASAEGLRYPEVFENPDVTFEDLACTAYYCGTITATGVPVHEGICANNKHVGDLAVLYLEDGTYLGTFECCDTGGTVGLQKGVVIDVYRENYERCVEWMKLTRGRVRVMWIPGEG